MYMVFFLLSVHLGGLPPPSQYQKAGYASVTGCTRRNTNKHQVDPVTPYPRPSPTPFRDNFLALLSGDGFMWRCDRGTIK